MNLNRTIFIYNYMLLLLYIVIIVNCHFKSSNFLTNSFSFARYNFRLTFMVCYTYIYYCGIINTKKHLTIFDEILLLYRYVKLIQTHRRVWKKISFRLWSKNLTHLTNIHSYHIFILYTFWIFKKILKHFYLISIFFVFLQKNTNILN